MEKCEQGSLISGSTPVQTSDSDDEGISLASRYGSTTNGNKSTHGQYVHAIRRASPAQSASKDEVVARFPKEEAICGSCCQEVTEDHALLVKCKCEATLIHDHERFTITGSMRICDNCNQTPETTPVDLRPAIDSPEREKVKKWCCVS